MIDATRPRFSLLGEGHLLAEGPLPLDLAWQSRFWAIAREAQGWAGVVEAVLGMNNLMLGFDPQVARPEELRERVLVAWEHGGGEIPVGRVHEIAVTYGGDVGLDLRELAERERVDVDEIVRRHTAPEYVVWFVGGYPGQPHLGGLHPSLVSPRRSQPRMQVPQGAVAIGGEQTTVYPSTQPGGLQLIGVTDVCFFDIAKSRPALLSPGDRVRFRALAILA